MRMEELYHIGMLGKDMGLQFRKFRRHQALTSSLVKGSSISRVATFSDFKLPKKSAVAWWFPRKKSVNNFHFPSKLSYQKASLSEIAYNSCHSVVKTSSLLVSYKLKHFFPVV